MSMFEAAGTGLLLGLASAAHCAGMCGAFALQAASATRGRAALRDFCCYVLGKTFTYVFLGALAGAAGAGVAGLGTWARSSLGILTALVMAWAAVALLRPATRASLPGGRLATWLAPLQGLVGGGRGPAGRFALGMTTGAIPCGVVYVAALQAAHTGSAGPGAAVMASFGLGTVPVLLAVGLLVRHGSLHHPRLRPAGGVLLVLVAGLTLWRALSPLLTAVGSGAAPCCH